MRKPSETGVRGTGSRCGLEVQIHPPAVYHSHWFEGLDGVSRPAAPEKNIPPPPALCQGQFHWEEEPLGCQPLTDAGEGVASGRRSGDGGVEGRGNPRLA